MILISPHLDDAVLSCGQVLVATPGAKIVTVFAGVPESELPLTNFDVQSGWTAAHQAVEGRRLEDRRAAAVLAADCIHLDFLDRQYAIQTQDIDIIEALVTAMQSDGDELILAPVGLAHPDHEQVSRCARAAAEQINVTVTWYEELPARVLWPEHVHIREELVQVHTLPAGDISIKEAAMTCYRSQLWALDRHACLVPERFWSEPT